MYTEEQLIPAFTLTGITNWRYTQPVVPGSPDASPTTVAPRHAVTVFTPVSDAVRYHQIPFTAPLQLKLIRCAVSTAY
jgi:hypothetical protein